MQKKDGNIKVFCRFRPFNTKQSNSNPTVLHRIAQKKQLIIKDSKSQEMSFMYDFVFDMNSTQEEVYQQVGNPVLSNIIDGFNGTIMAYGQTSSGKTHTMQGYDINDKQIKGIMPRIIDKLFHTIEKSSQSIEYKLKISIFELYMEKIRDLLDITKNDLKIRENKEGMYVENLSEVYVSQKSELLKIINYGQKNRITATTNMNQHSSRSHMIFLLNLNQYNSVEASSKTSKLFLIDLAGSEKISKTGAEGKVLEEAKKINLSLTNLGKVIKALSEKGGHIPYRDSKLTRILKDSLGGNSKTTLIVTCSPHQMHFSQTISTLRFGQNAQKVKNKPKINRQLTVQQLQKIIDKMQIEQKQKTTKIKILEDYIVNTLKAQLPKTTMIQQSQQKPQSETNQTNSNIFVNEEAQERIKKLQEQLQKYQQNMQKEFQKYYQLKRQYGDLHSNLTDILKQNIQLKEQLQANRHKFIENDKSIQNNAHLIKLIVGQIFFYIGKDKEKQIIEFIKGNHWYKTIMIEQTSCSEYWQIQKNEINKQLEELLSQTKMTDELKKKEEESKETQNKKIIQLQQKFDVLYTGYHEMVNLQTTWKAQCQLYQLKLKKKEEKIQDLQRKLEQISQQIDYFNEDNFDDILSVKSNRIVKPMKGGTLLR